MPFSFLDFFDEPPPWPDAELQAYVDLAMEAGMGDRTRRDILLMHVPQSVRDRFPLHRKLRDQLESDIRQLAALPPGYFERWVANGAELVHPQFRGPLLAALGLEKGRPDPIPPPSRPDPRRGKMGTRTKIIYLIALAALIGAALTFSKGFFDDPPPAVRRRVAPGSQSAPPSAP